MRPSRRPFIYVKRGDRIRRLNDGESSWILVKIGHDQGVEMEKV